jgi:hypothetical protein
MHKRVRRDSMTGTKKNILLVTGNSVFVIATIVINALAVLLPLNGKTTQELSDALPNLFVPAGITFSIWSVIYLFLIIFMLYQIVDVVKKRDMAYIEKIGGWFILASVANILWIFLWHYEYVPYSLGAMLLLLISLLMIYTRLNIGLSMVSLKEKIAVHTTMSIYLGWITVATIANVTAVLVYFNADGLFLGEVAWVDLVIAVATLITLLILLRRKDIAFSLVIIWALLGIVIKRLSDDPIYGVQIHVAITASIAILLIAGAVVLTILSMFSQKRVLASENTNP